MEALKDATKAGPDSMLKDVGLGDWAKLLSGSLKSRNMIESGNAAMLQGMGIDASKNYSADQLRENKKLAIAMAQRQAMEETRIGDIIGSDLEARAAANGDASSPDVIRMAGEIAAEADLRRATAMAQGRFAAVGMENQAKVLEFEGQIARDAGSRAQKQSRFGAGVNTLSTVLGFADNLTFGSKYGEAKQLGALHGAKNPNIWT